MSIAAASHTNDRSKDLEVSPLPTVGGIGDVDACSHCRFG
jgi:hypothetical protein